MKTFIIAAAVVLLGVQSGAALASEGKAPPKRAPPPRKASAKSDSDF